MSWHKVIAGKIRELRFVCCQVSQHSEGVRKFVSNNYFKVKIEQLVRLQKAKYFTRVSGVFPGQHSH